MCRKNERPASQGGINEPDAGWLDEAVDEYEAGRVVGESVPTLRTKRTRGGGPVFVKNGSTVRYIRRDLFDYLAVGRRASTSDTSKAA